MINTPRRLPRVPKRAEAASEISMNIVGVARAIRIDRRNNGERRARADYVFARGTLTRGMPTRGFEFFRRPAEVYRQSSYRGTAGCRHRACGRAGPSFLWTLAC